MNALIDGDVLVYRIGFTTEKDVENIAKARMEEMIDGIFTDTGAKNYKIYLSDSTENSFRSKILPEYKKNRTAPKPRHYNFLREFLIKYYDAKITPEQEADDALGIEQTLQNHTAWNCYLESDYSGNKFMSIICSIDKDLLQIPGLHYDFVKKHWNEISFFESKYRFYHQLLTGDRTDNVQGIPRVGPVTADEILEETTCEEEMFIRSREAYQEYYQLKKNLTTQEIDDIMLRNGQVLKIRTTEGEIWKFPNIEEQTQLPEFL